MKTVMAFSLLELLIVMVIVAILALVAYPLYTHYLAKGRRNQAEIGLLHLASQLETFYSLNDTYQGATLAALGVKDYNDDHTYQYNIQSATQANYLVEATPVNSAMTQDACGTLSLNETGDRMVSGSTPAAQCWN